jgi:hypothetical protein
MRLNICAVLTDVTANANTVGGKRWLGDRNRKNSDNPFGVTPHSVSFSSSADVMIPRCARPANALGERRPRVE